MSGTARIDEALRYLSAQAGVEVSEPLVVFSDCEVFLRLADPDEEEGFFDRPTVWVYNIEADPGGTERGTQVLALLREFCNAHDYDLFVGPCMPEALGYWEAQAWLSRTREFGGLSCYAYTPTA